MKVAVSASGSSLDATVDPRFGRAREGVQTVITGSLGPNASQVLSASGIKMVTGARGTVRQAVDDFRGGRLSPNQIPSYAGGFGMSRRKGMGRGMGRGMGMGGAG